MFYVCGVERGGKREREREREKKKKKKITKVKENIERT